MISPSTLIANDAAVDPPPIEPTEEVVIRRRPAGERCFGRRAGTSWWLDDVPVARRPSWSVAGRSSSASEVRSPASTARRRPGRPPHRRWPPTGPSAQPPFCRCRRCTRCSMQQTTRRDDEAEPRSSAGHRHVSMMTAAAAFAAARRRHRRPRCHRRTAHPLGPFAHRADPVRCVSRGRGQVLLGREHRLRTGRRARRPAPARRRLRSAARRRSPAHASTSSHVTGVDTVGSGRARNEYGAIVVLWWAFWLQSTKTLPGRTAFAITVVTLPGMLPLEHLADGEREVGRGLVRDAVGVERARTSAGPSSPTSCTSPRGSTAASTSRTPSATRAALDDRRPRRPGRSRTPAPAACRGRRRAPSARAARSRPCWPPTPAPPARRCGSTRCRPSRSPGPERHRHPLGPVRRAALLEEALLRRCRSGSGGTSAHRPARCGMHHRRDAGVVVDRPRPW